MPENTDSFMFQHSLPKVLSPKASVIIIVHNNLDITKACLKSLIDCTEPVYELILVDNGSGHITHSYLERLENVKLIVNSTNTGFGQAANQAAQASFADYVIFLNNDTVVTKGRLSSLLYTVELNSHCGAVGSKLIGFDGKLLEAGGIIWKDGAGMGYGRGSNPGMPEYSFIREVDYCSAASLLVRKDLFMQIGGFDGRYQPAYYEDADLCMEIQKKGYKIFFQPESIVYHREFGTKGRQESLRLHRINQNKFVNKWKCDLKNRLKYSENNILRARDKSCGKKVLFIDDRVPTPEAGQGYPRAYQMVKILQELGYQVTLFPFVDTCKFGSVTGELQQLGIEAFYGNDLDFSSFIDSRRGYYDIIFVSRPDNMTKARGFVKKYFPQATIIYDAEALFTLRDISIREAKGELVNNEYKEAFISSEIALTNMADFVITVSEKEKNEMIKRQVPVSKIGVWEHAVRLPGYTNGFGDRCDLLFVGAFPMPGVLNEDAVSYFIKDIFPYIKKKIDCKFRIVGKGPSKALQSLSSESIIFEGYADNLSNFYNRCRVFVVPTRHSGGISLKLIEAMANGIPAVVSASVAEQLSLIDRKQALVADGACGFADKVVELYTNEYLWGQIKSGALEYISENFDYPKMKSKLEYLLKKAVNLHNSNMQNYFLRIIKNLIDG